MMVRFWQALTKIAWSIIGHCSAQDLANPLGFNLGPEFDSFDCSFQAPLQRPGQALDNIHLEEPKQTVFKDAKGRVSCT